MNVQRLIDELDQLAALQKRGRELKARIHRANSTAEYRAIEQAVKALEIELAAISVTVSDLGTKKPPTKDG